MDKIKPYTIGEKGIRGGNAKDTGQFINGVFWIWHTGAIWRDLPSEYGYRKNIYRRFCRWRDNSNGWCELQDDITLVISPNKNRKVIREFNKRLYKLRYLVENAFLHLKKWYSFATLCARNVSSFVSAVQIRCIAIWLKIYWRHTLNKAKNGEQLIGKLKKIY